MDGGGSWMSDRVGGEAGWMENWGEGERRVRGWMDAGVE